MKKKQTFAPDNSNRPVDSLTDDVVSWWKKRYIYMSRTEVRMKHILIAVAFLAGIIATAIMIVKFDYQSNSSANIESATLALSPQNINVSANQNFSIDILLDTRGNNAVAATSIVTYDNTQIQLLGYDTAGSVFASSNTCVYANKPCEIIQNDAANGKISITLAKPTPGVNVVGGLFAKLNFKVIKSSGTSGIQLAFNSLGNYDDSDVILDDGNGTDILNSVINTTVNIAAPSCTSFTYSTWGACQADGTQSRTITSSLPDGCSGGNPTLKQSCDISAPTCTSFNYSSWGSCQSDNTQTRTVTSSSPTGCTGGSPVTSQSCKYVPDTPVCEKFTYTNWSACTNNTQERKVISSYPDSCSGGATPIVNRSCISKVKTCDRFSYTSWGECVNGSKKRSVIRSYPYGCEGGDPVLTSGC
jgi:hypothetical protein